MAGLYPSDQHHTIIDGERHMIKRLLAVVALTMLTCTAVTGASAAKHTIKTQTVQLNPMMSHVAGTATITYNSHMSQTTVVLRVMHLAVGTHLAHFHTGKCGSNGAVKYPLTPLVGPGTKTSTTIFTGKLTGTLYINVHGTPKSAMQVVSCGDVK